VKVHRLGWLNGTNPTANAPILARFRQALGELGYVEGQNLIIEYRWGDGSEVGLVEPAAELARLPVDVFVVPSTTLAQIAHEATTTVPIVVARAGDPVAAGLAASYARPGGNVTGVMGLTTELNGKRLQLLKEAVPSISRVAVLYDAATPGQYPSEASGRDARAVDVQLHVMELRGPEEFDAAFEAAAREGADALLLAPNPLSNAHRARIIELAARHRWPAMYPLRQFVDDGGLMAYDGNLTDLWRRVAAFVDKILKGAKPADLPVELPTKFELVINLKTAKALGLTIPQSLLVRADQLIE